MSDSRRRILDELLTLAPFEGWTEHALGQAARPLGLNAREIFPGGIREALDHFFAAEDEALARQWPREAIAKLRMGERIETLIRARLERCLPWREAIRRAVANRLLPWNAAEAAASLYRSVDRMWRLAGDASTDFSFYTKRATLAALYSSTLLYWLNDRSERQEDTHEFLRRRLKNIADFGKWRKKVTQQK